MKLWTFSRWVSAGMMYLAAIIYTENSTSAKNPLHPSEQFMSANLPAAHCHKEEYGETEPAQ